MSSLMLHETIEAAAIGDGPGARLPGLETSASRPVTKKQRPEGRRYTNIPSQTHIPQSRWEVVVIGAERPITGASSNTGGRRALVKHGVVSAGDGDAHVLVDPHFNFGIV